LAAAFTVSTLISLGKAQFTTHLMKGFSSRFFPDFQKVSSEVIGFELVDGERIIEARASYNG
jgi:hypothetical protein